MLEEMDKEHGNLHPTAQLQVKMDQGGIRG